jgi:hypothetical protein
MIPGGWFRTPGGLTQHWRRHGIGESVCSANVPNLGNGSLLPLAEVTVCPQCLRVFKVEAFITLPKILHLANQIAEYAKP